MRPSAGPVPDRSRHSVPSSASPPCNHILRLGPPEQRAFLASRHPDRGDLPRHLGRARVHTLYPSLSRARLSGDTPVNQSLIGVLPATPTRSMLGEYRVEDRAVRPASDACTVSAARWPKRCCRPRANWSSHSSGGSRSSSGPRRTAPTAPPESEVFLKRDRSAAWTNGPDGGPETGIAAHVRRAAQ